MASGDHYELTKAKSKIHALVRALMGIGYDEASAIEISGSLIEEAAKDGINTRYLLSVLDKISPIKKQETDS